MMKTEREIIQAGRVSGVMAPCVQTVYLMEDDTVAAWLQHEDGSEKWSAYIEASLDPDDPQISDVAYEVALAELYEADEDLKPHPILYSLDPPIDRS